MSIRSNLIYTVVQVLYLLIFCLGLLVLLNWGIEISIYYSRSISPFNSVSVCFIYFGILLFGVYMLINVHIVYTLTLLSIYNILLVSCNNSYLESILSYIRMNTTKTSWLPLHEIYFSNHLLSSYLCLFLDLKASMLQTGSNPGLLQMVFFTVCATREILDSI